MSHVTPCHRDSVLSVKFIFKRTKSHMPALKSHSYEKIAEHSVTITILLHE
jgi:hypothetical protein